MSINDRSYNYRTDAERAIEITIFDSKGRVDQDQTHEANKHLFSTVVRVAGSMAIDVAATQIARVAAKTAVVANHRSSK